MSAVLSPAEQQEVTRFGIHDDDVIADMEAHLDDIVPCIAPSCTNEARWQIIMICCGAAFPMCGEHLTRHRVRASFILDTARNRTFCKSCQASLTGLDYDEVFRTVTL